MSLAWAEIYLLMIDEDPENNARIDQHGSERALEHHTQMLIIYTVRTGQSHHTYASSVVVKNGHLIQNRQQMVS